MIMKMWSSRCCMSHGKFLVALLIFVKKMEVSCDYGVVLSAASSVLCAYSTMFSLGVYVSTDILRYSYT